MERVKGIEPSYEAWEAAVLPLNYTRVCQIIKARDLLLPEYSQRHAVPRWRTKKPRKTHKGCTWPLVFVANNVKHWRAK